MKILFVDLENVCRSPLAASLLKKKIEDFDLKGEVDSAGFESFNINEPPDKRIVDVARQNGLTVTGKARLFKKEDFNKFDKIYVMDTVAYNNVEDLCDDKKVMEKVDYALNLLPGNARNESIPNPFLTGTSDCQKIYDMLDKITDRIVDNIKN